MGGHRIIADTAGNSRRKREEKKESILFHYLDLVILDVAKVAWRWQSVSI
jgi:hypothetical protein